MTHTRAVESSHKQEYSHWIETESGTTLAAVMNRPGSDKYAAIIAAAPELLEAVKWCRSSLEELGYTVSQNVIDAIAKAEAQK